MARLFITPREQQQINDWTKEFIKDVVGSYVIYYPVSMLKTKVHRVYDEAVEKIFDHPIKIDCLVGQPERGQRLSTWAIEGTTKIEVMIQARDLVDKGFDGAEAGDFFVYGNEVFEVLDSIEVGDVFGQAEYNIYWKLTGKLARSGRFDLENFHKLLEDSKTFSKSNVQKTFEQQRGIAENETEGVTGDVRQVRERLSDDMAATALGEGGRKINSDDEEDTSDTTLDKSSSSFYNE